MPEKTYHCHTPNSSVTFSDGRTIRFAGNHFTTSDETMQKELDAVVGKSQISEAAAEPTLEQQLAASQEADLLSKQLAQAAAAQMGETNAIAAAVGGQVTQVPAATIEATAQAQAAALLAARQ